MKTTQEILDFYGVEIGKTYKIVKQDDGVIRNFIGDTFKISYYDYYLAINDSLCIIFLEKAEKQPIHKLLDFEYKEVKEILTDKERTYLSAVIKPFRSRVTSMSKQIDTLSKREYIRMNVYPNDFLILPSFETNQMYKGMEINKYYTLEELRL